MHPFHAAVVHDVRPQEKATSQTPWYPSSVPSAAPSMAREKFIASTPLPLHLLLLLLQTPRHENRHVSLPPPPVPTPPDTGTGTGVSA